MRIECDKKYIRKYKRCKKLLRDVGKCENWEDVIFLKKYNKYAIRNYKKISRNLNLNYRRKKRPYLDETRPKNIMP